MKREKPYTIVQLVAIDETGDSYYRMRWPAKHLAEQAPAWRIISLDARATERFLWGEQADLLILYQTNDLDLLPLIQKRRKLGRKTLVEYNDNFYAPPASSPVAGVWSSPLIWQAYERFMLECDAVMVTGTALQKLFATKTTKPIHVISNHLPEAPAPFSKLWPDSTSGIQLGWAGSVGHMADFLAILPTLQRLFEQFPQLTLSLMGNESLPGFVALPSDRLRFSKWGSMKEYFAFMKGFHLGLAPLLPTPYNDCRSDIKAVELSAAGALPILSDAQPYREFLQATGAPVIKHFSEFETVLRHYVQNLELAREQAERCHNYVAENRLGKIRLERLEFYEQFLAEQPSAHPWPFPVGAHEIIGTTQNVARDASVIAKIQELMQQRKRRAAVSVLQQELSQNPFHPGFALAELKILAGPEGKQQWEEKLQSCLERFPGDLRFSLLHMGSEADETELDNKWLELINRLMRATPGYQEFFAANVIALYCQQLPRNSALISHGETLLEIYPHSAALRFTMAEFYEKHGDYDRALRHFTWLIEARRAHTSNHEFLSKSELSYLRTWKEALEARMDIASGEIEAGE